MAGAEHRDSSGELRKAVTWFGPAVDHAVDALFVQDDGGTIVDVNRQACESLGYAAEEIIGSTPALFDPGLYRDDAFRQRNRERLDAGEIVSFETSHRRRDGTSFPVEVRIRRFWEGERPFALCSARDITELRKAADERRASEARFRTFVDHAADGFFVLDAGLSVVDVNRQACLSLGYSREELIGMHPREFDASLNDSSIERLARRADTGETLTFETLHRRKDGSLFPVEIRTHLFEQGGEPFYLCLVRDVSERRRAEEELAATEARFRTLVDFAADAFMLHASDSTVIDVNLQACISLGYTREELIGMTPVDFDADVDPETLKQIVARVEGSEPFTFETRHRRKDGTVFPVEVRARQVRQAGRLYAISMARDITERKLAEQERERLRRLETELARVNRVTAMGELAASIAHEVSQPLGAMVANAAACERWLATRPPETQKARRTLQAISADGERAREVIGRIRALMKRQEPRKSSLDVNEAIREVVALVHQEESLHRIVLETLPARSLPPVQGDKIQLQQVLLNLVINAIEAMSGIDDRPRALTIASRSDGAAVVVEVRDCGPGLETKTADRLFEAFYTTKPQGLGIGLSISRSIIEAHGGRLWAEANAPHGAVFLLSLPAES